jgi:hypothetical protein
MPACAMTPDATPDECFAVLHRASWSLAESHWLTAGGVARCADGTNAEYVLRAEADSLAVAGRAACAQARSLGMLGRAV